MKGRNRVFTGLLAVGMAAGVTLLSGDSLFASAATTAVNPQTNLTISINSSTPYTNDFNPASPDERGGANLMWEPLYIINQVNGKVTPWLATSWKWSDGGRVLTFTIRKGVKWSNGTPFGPNDVVFTYNLLKKYPALDGNGIWNYLTSVRAKGDKVIFTLNSPNSLVFQALPVAILPEAIWSKVKNPVTWADPNPVVTGPYVLQSLNSQEYVLKKNPLWWGKNHSYPDTITVVPTTNNTGVMELDDGSLSWVGLFIPNIQHAYVDHDPKVNHYWFPESVPIALYMNLTRYPFNLTKFRQALDYAMDKTAMADKGEYGYTTRASATDIVLPYDREWMDAAVNARYQYHYNLKKAAAILKSIGFHLNAQHQLISPKGKPVSFKIEVPSGWTDWIEDADIAQSSLHQLGIDAQVYTPSANAYFNDMTMGNFQTTIWSESGDADPGALFFQMFDSMMSAPIGKSANSNTERWYNKDSDQWINEYITSTSPAKQKQALFHLEAQVAQQLPVIPLFYGPVWNEYRTNQYVGWPTAKDPYAAPDPDLWPDALMVVTHLHPAH